LVVVVERRQKSEDISKVVLSLKKEKLLILVLIYIRFKIRKNEKDL
jgi:hypothetical protein